MASKFRYSIAKRVIQSLVSDTNNQVIHKDSSSPTSIASYIRIKNQDLEKPQFTLPWDKITSHFNVDISSLNTDLIKKLKGNGLILPDGILDVHIEAKDERYPELVFTVSASSFIEETLIETFNHIANLKNVSPLLQSVLLQRNIVEYSSPNIAKPFHAGHIRSTIIGNVLANLQNYIGHDVTRINYLGDWGTQFGILTAGIDAFAPSINIDDFTLKDLVNIYIAANMRAKDDQSFSKRAREIFNEMEEGNKDLLTIWRKLRSLSISEFEKTYRRLGVEFDHIEGESMYSRMAFDVIEEIKQKNLGIILDDGAVKIPIKSVRQDIVEMPLLKNDGSTLYMTRDIAAAINRKSEYQFDNMYYVVENGQNEHFSALKEILAKIGYDWSSSLQHVKFGRIGGLSTRKGQVVFLDELLNQAKTLALKSMQDSPNTKVDQEDEEETADILGVSAVIVNDLKARRQNDYAFDWKKVLHNKGDSGIELQYNHAILSSLDRTFGKILTTEFDTSVLFQPEALRLVTHIAKFDEAILDANVTLQPCILVQYLFKLCNLIGKANRVLPIKGNERRIAESRYFLFHVSKLVLNQGMKILGLKPLEKM